MAKAFLQVTKFQGAGKKSDVGSGSNAAKQPIPREDAIFLEPSDFHESLVGKRLQVFWPEDKKWWHVTVIDIELEANTATLLYDTSEF